MLSVILCSCGALDVQSCEGLEDLSGTKNTLSAKRFANGLTNKFVYNNYKTSYKTEIIKQNEHAKYKHGVT